jgi:hypothetical protein
MALSWRDRQKKFFANSNTIEFEQDQRIIDWLDTSKKTWVYGETYFDNKVQLTNNISTAEQALLFIKNAKNINVVEHLCKFLVDVPRVCVAINKFVIYTDDFKNDFNEDYDLALLEFIQSIFVNRKIDYHYIPNLNGSYFNFASPTTQFFIT